MRKSKKYLKIKASDKLILLAMMQFFDYDASYDDAYCFSVAAMKKKTCLDCTTIDKSIMGLADKKLIVFVAQYGEIGFVLSYEIRLTL